MRFVMALVFSAALSIASAAAQDVEGSEDHPIITRYPGSTIEWYEIENYRPYRVLTGPVTGYRAVEEGIDTEGRVTRIYYALDGGERTFSEVYKNYLDALEEGGFEILAEGIEPATGRAGVGSRQWREVLFRTNTWDANGGAVNQMTAGSSTSGGGGTVVARKERAAGTAYVVVSVYQFREDRVSTLVDVVEVEAAETGLIAVDAEAIGKGIEEDGRVVLDGIYFDFDKATIQPQSSEALEQITIYLNENADMNFYVVGHTDSKGTLAYNQNLSAERARAVVEELVSNHGIARERLEGHGVGPLSPVFSNATDAGSDRNRRVELVER